MKGKAAESGMIFGMVAAWAVYYTASKLEVDACGSPFLAGFLLRAAALVFLTIQLGAMGKLPQLLRQGKTLIVLLSIGVFGFLLDTFANLGYQSGSLSVGTALLKTDVLMVNLTTVLVCRKKLYVSDWAGTLVMLFGVLLVLGVRAGEASIHWTDLYFLLSAACVTANAFLIKAAEEKYGADTDIIGYYNNLVVVLLFFLASLFTGAFEGLGEKTAGQLPMILLGGLAQTLIYFFYYRNLKRHEVWLVKLYLLFMPVLSCFLGAAFLGETLTAPQILGIGVMLCGAAAILLREKIHAFLTRKSAG